jgi:hypothetical protein
VNAVMNLRVPQHAGNFLANFEPVSFLRRTLLNGVGTVRNCKCGLAQRIQQDRQCTYNVTLRRVPATIVVVQKQYYILYVCVCVWS